jgi:peptide/nickel transport system substrate-binding protein
MKRLLSVLVIAILAFSMTACQQPKPKGTVIVGTPAMNGDFINGFGNNAYDVAVRTMIFGLGTYTTTPAGEFVLDPQVAKSVVTETDAAGNKTYTFDLQTNMKWSDGAKVTANDFVFGILFAASPEWKTAGASSTVGRELVGWSAYNTGASNVFEGVKLLGEFKFSVTIDAKNLPYFYEVAYASYGPTPLHVWGQGVTIGADGSSLTGDLTAAANYVATTERFAPTVASGPFKFVSYENETVTLVYNEHFVGDYRGHKPKVESVIVRYINQVLDVDLVISGDVDIVAGVIEGAKIEKAKSSDQADVVSYKRNGYGMIAFTNDFGPTQSKWVRQALGHLIDRNEFLINILEGYGAVTNGEYGLSQWMYVAKAAELEDTLVNYVLNVDTANDLLDKTEWVFEADGVTPWDRSKATEGYWRHNAEGVELLINHFGTIDNPITDLIGAEWPRAMNQAGVKFYLEYGDFNALLDNYYYAYLLGDERKFNSFNLATGFTAVYDPYYSLHSDFLGTWQNATGVNDPEIDRLVTAMRSLEPTQKDEYLELWFEYQVYWNEILPVLPIYSNEYFDVFNKRVTGLATTPLYGWARAIIDVQVKE